MQTYAKQDTFCKDVVNVTKKVETEGSSRISFMGAEGHEIQIDCPKVSPGPRHSAISLTFLVTPACVAERQVNTAGHLHTRGWPTE